MARGELSPTSIAKMSGAQQQLVRDQAMGLARDALKVAPLTTHELFDSISATRSTGASAASSDANPIDILGTGAQRSITLHFFSCYMTAACERGVNKVARSAKTSCKCRGDVLS
jgi:hypothetical protein